MLVLTFKYSGGSHPNQERTVYFNVDKMPSAGTVGGWDFGADDYRRFDIRKMTNIKVEQGVETDIATLPSCIKADDVVKGYEADGMVAHYDSTNNVVVAYKKSKKVPTVIINGNSVKFHNGKDFYTVYNSQELDEYDRKRIGQVLNG